MGPEFKFFGMSMAYMGFEFLGGLLASGMHRVVRPKEYGGEGNSMVSNITSEFMGTFYLVLTVCFNVYGGSKCGAWSIAASLMCMIYALGNVSGAHFNPAVTVAILMSGRGKIALQDALWYILAQLLGGVAAGLTTVTLLQRAAPLGPVG